MDQILKTAIEASDDIADAINKAKDENSSPDVGGADIGDVDKGETNTETIKEKLGDDTGSQVLGSVLKSIEHEIELEYPDELKGAEKLRKQLQAIEMVNEELIRQGHKRRYVAHKSDAPGDAHVHEDAFGKYYYEKLDTEIRPSDIAEQMGAISHKSVNESDMAGGVVELLYEKHAQPLMDANTIEAAQSWLERHMVLIDEDPGSSDTFSHEFKDKVANGIADINSETKEKDRVYVDDPSEVPEGYDVQEGNQGGYYYETGGGGGQQTDSDSLESRVSGLVEQLGRRYDDPQQIVDEAMDVFEETLYEEYGDTPEFEEAVAEVEDMVQSEVRQQTGGGGEDGGEGGEGGESALDEELAGGHTVRDVANGIADDFVDEMQGRGAYSGRSFEEAYEMVEDEAESQAQSFGLEGEEVDEFVDQATSRFETSYQEAEE